MSVEVWKDVVGFEGLYQVSDLGRVRSMDRVIETSNGKKFPVKRRVMKQPTDRNGYPFVGLRRPGKQTVIRTHVMVAKAFLGEPGPGEEVCHNNGDPSDSRLSNLRYDTRSNNLLDCREHGSGRFVSVLRSDGKFYERTNKVEEDGFCRKGVQATCSGRQKTHGGYGWTYGT
jgi:hypothetical protein